MGQFRNELHLMLDEHDSQPELDLTLRTSSPNSSVSALFIPAVGSSRRSNFGLEAMARAISTRRRSG